MQVNPYLYFKGDCEAAFTFYANCLGGDVRLFRYAGSPLEHSVPPDWSDKVMHATLTVGSQALNGADVVPENYEVPKGFALSLNLQDSGDAERMFRALAGGGRVTMPLEKTFWAERFGMVVDRFGISWLINCESVGVAGA